MSNNDNIVIETNINKKSTNGGVIMFIGHGFQFIVGIGTSAILARLLTPADFGVVGMALVIIEVLDSIRTFGISEAIVQRLTLTKEQLSATFWIGALIHLIILLLICSVANPLAKFFAQPNLVYIFFVMGIAIAMHGLSITHNGLLHRQMRYNLLAFTEVLSLTLGAFIGILCAFLNFSFWALVLQYITILLTRTIVIWLVCNWYPNPPWCINWSKNLKIGEMISYGGYLSFTRLTNHIGKRIDHFLIGKFAGTSLLGLYQVANRWSLFPFMQIYSPMNPIAFGALSRLRQNNKDYRIFAQKLFLILFSLTLPLHAFLFIIADQLILFLLGNQWSSAVEIFQILLISNLCAGISLMTEWIYHSEGRTQQQSPWIFFTTIVLVCIVIITIPSGVKTVAIGLAIANGILVLPSLLYCLRFSPIKVSDFFKPFFLAGLSTLCIIVTMIFFVPFVNSMTTILPLKLFIEGLFYLIILAIFWLSSTNRREQVRTLISFFSLNISQ